MSQPCLNVSLISGNRKIHFLSLNIILVSLLSDKEAGGGGGNVHLADLEGRIFLSQKYSAVGIQSLVNLIYTEFLGAYQKV